MTNTKYFLFFIKELNKNKSKITKVFFTIFLSLLIFSTVTIFKNSIESEESVTGFHFLRTRHSANTNFVDVHLVFTPDVLLLDAHRVSDSIEDKIKKLDHENEWVMNIHLDPYDDSHVQEHHTS